MIFLKLKQRDYYQQRIDDHFREAVNLYESLLHSGVAKECARSVLTIEYGNSVCICLAQSAVGYTM